MTLPATVTVPQGGTNAAFSVTTSSVTAATSVPFPATFNGVTVSSAITLSPAPVVAVSALSIPLTQIGGQPVAGTVSVSNFPRNTGGVVIVLTSGDTKTIASSTVTIPQGAFSATFTLATTVVTGTKGVSLKATLGASKITSNISILPIPTISGDDHQHCRDIHLWH